MRLSEGLRRLVAYLRLVLRQVLSLGPSLLLSLRLGLRLGLKLTLLSSSSGLTLQLASIIRLVQRKGTSRGRLRPRQHWEGRIPLHALRVQRGAVLRPRSDARSILRRSGCVHWLRRLVLNLRRSLRSLLRIRRLVRMLDLAILTLRTSVLLMGRGLAWSGMPWLALNTS